MATSSDWAQHEDSNATSLPVDTPDLFGGVLFGDELIDMYNSEAVVGEHSHEIPLLHAGPDDKMDDVSSMDDGFGAFRPSTSFNDLTTLLDSAAPAEVTSAAPVDKKAVVAAAPKKSGGGKKRAATNEATGKVAGEGPAAKKRATVRGAKVAVAAQGGRRGGAKSKAATATKTAAPPPQSASNAALKLRHEQQAMLLARTGKAGNDTPNPLMAPVGKTPVATSIAGAVAKARAQATLKVSGGKGDSITSEAAAAKAAAAAASVSLPTAASKSLSGKRTESDFKSVAQAAVTNLILNAGTKKSESAPAAVKSSVDVDGFNIKVDTSTAHIKALTSTNWVNACSGVEGPACSAAIDNKANNRARRQNLTPDERARQNRDRNREHARNTRLRKKAYVEELKRTLTELVAQRDAADLEKRHAAQRELEQREVRFRVMEEFLKLRGRNEPNSARWVAILEDSFKLTLPVTSFRETVNEKNDDTELEQELYGAEEVMADAAHVSALLQSLDSTKSSSTPVTLEYDCDRKNFFMDGATAVLQWNASSDGAIGKGAVGELSIKGAMQAKFSPASNKLISAEITFDTGSVSSQLDCLVRNGSAGANQVDAAAQAAHRADALLDSLQMPHLTAKVPSAISLEAHNVTSADESAAHSVSSSDKGDLSSDESTEEPATKGTKVVSPRRSTRVHG